MLSACEKNPAGNSNGQSNDVGTQKSLTLTPISKLNTAAPELNSHKNLTGRSVLSPIYGTYVRLDKSVTNEDKTLYPRFVKTSAGDYLCFYHYYGNGVSSAGNECEYMRSSDLINWSYEKKPFALKAFKDCTGANNKRAYAGAHVVRMKDGNLLAVASTRAISQYRLMVPDNGLAIIISTDNGRTWSEEQIIYVGTNWEPMPVVLPDGRIQIYYTDSKHVPQLGENAVSSGSSYIWSDDNGKTWQGGSNDYNQHEEAFAQVRVSIDGLNVLTDQMPAVIALNGSKRLAAAAESFISTGASYEPYETYISLAYSDESGNWGQPDNTGRLPLDRNDNFIEGCAPYLSQFPSGETVLTYNENNVFYMMTGDENARNFANETKVFSQTANTGKGYWGSTYCVDSHILVAGIGGSESVMQIGQFYLNHAIKAADHKVTADGDNTDWSSSDEALWICSLGETKATVRSAKDSDNLYFILEVSDKDISKDDYVQVFLADPSKDKIDQTSLRIKASYMGLKNAGNYAGGWKDSEIGAKVSSAYDGTPSDQTDSDNGYVVEISVPLSSVPVKDGMVLANFSLFDIKNGGEDAIVSTADRSTDGWVPVIGL